MKVTPKHQICRQGGEKQGREEVLSHLISFL